MPQVRAGKVRPAEGQASHVFELLGVANFVAVLPERSLVAELFREAVQLLLDNENVTGSRGRRAADRPNLDRKEAMHAGR